MKINIHTHTHTHTPCDAGSEPSLPLTAAESPDLKGRRNIIRKGSVAEDNLPKSLTPVPARGAEPQPKMDHFGADPPDLEEVLTMPGSLRSKRKRRGLSSVKDDNLQLVMWVVTEDRK